MKIVVIVVLMTFAVVHSTQNKRISRQKCEEYSEQTNKFACVSDTYPFVGAVGNEGVEGKIDWTCSGTLISDQYVLVPAHCNQNPIYGPIKNVRFGELDVNHPNSNAETYAISQIIRHPDFKRPSVYNDIALLKLERPVTFTEFIRPACLYNGQDLSQYNIAGYSFIATNETRRGLLVHEKNTVLSDEECSKTFQKGRKLKDGVIFEKQFCMKDGSISCEINSGASVVLKDEELPCMQNIAGMGHVGKGNCLVNSTSLNVKISGYIDWIESIVWP